MDIWVHRSQFLIGDKFDKFYQKVTNIIESFKRFNGKNGQFLKTNWVKKSYFGPFSHMKYIQSYLHVDGATAPTLG